MSETRERWRYRLPHWEVADRPHFVTIRVAGALPPAVREQVRAVHETLRVIEPGSVEFTRLQRRYFLICEKYLEAADGDARFAPFRAPEACEVVLAEWRGLAARDGWSVGDAVIMPNHVHCVLHPQAEERAPLRAVLRGFKGRTARAANQALRRTGAFWQSDWFDRWLRTEAEVRRVTDYILQNPVRAGLVGRAVDWPWRLEEVATERGAGGGPCEAGGCEAGAG